MDWFLPAILITLPLILLLAIGTPIAFSLGLISVAALFIAGGLPAVSAVQYIPLGVLSNFVMAPIPLFVLMAELLIISGISRDLFDAVNDWVGGLPGGVAIATILTGAVIGAMCGISAASVAILAVFCIDEFERFNYRRSLTSGCIGATGALSILIPPSVPLIMYGALSEQSIAQLFIAGILPGILLSILFALYCLGDGIKNKNRYLKHEKVSWSVKLKHLVYTGPAFLIVALVLGAIYLGYATATESAALGCFAVLIMCILKRKLTVKRFFAALLNSIEINCMIFMVLICAMLFGHTMTYLNLPQTISTAVLSLKIPSIFVLISSQLVLFALGCFLDIVSIILITTPILLPIILSLGYDPIWFGILMMVNMEMALMTPPVGLNLWVFYGMAQDKGFKLGPDVIRGIVPFLILDAVLIILLMIFPEIVLWLPGLVK